MRTHSGEDIWRRETPLVLAALVHRFGDFAACEDAVQEALIDSSRQWKDNQVPEHPRGWLIKTASRRYIDQLRRESARRNREQRVFIGSAVERVDDPGRYVENEDSTLEMLTLCCHPELAPESQVTLILRTVLGLSTKQIAGLYLIPPSTAGQRISRAKAIIDHGGRVFPATRNTNERLHGVRHALYLLYTAGHASPSGEGTAHRDLIREDLTGEAIRLARLLRQRCADDGETGGLLALLLITEARRQARLDQEGEIVPLKNQDRTRWDRDAIAEGAQILNEVLPTGRVGPISCRQPLLPYTPRRRHGRIPIGNRSWNSTGCSLVWRHPLP